MQLLGERSLARKIERRAILRILAVAQRLRDGDGQRERTGKLAREQTGFEIARDRGIVFGRAFEGARREPLAHRGIDAVRQGGCDLGVLRRIAEHGNVLEVLGRSANQRNAADIDLLECFLERRARARDGFFERIQIDDDVVELRNLVLRGFFIVFGIAAVRKNRPEDFGVQRLDAAVEERRKTGQLADVMRVDSVLDQMRARSARRVDRNSGGA